MTGTHITADYLSACLLEAVADENWSNVQFLLQSYHAPAFRVVRLRGIAPIHFAAGMEHIAFGRRTVELMLTDCAESDGTGAGGGGGLRSCIDTPTNEGETALQVATMSGHAEIVRLLLAEGASLERRDADGFNALDYALREGYYELVQMFRGVVLAQKKQQRRQRERADVAVPAPIVLTPKTERSPVEAQRNEERSPARLAVRQALAPPQQQQPQQLLTPQRIPYNMDRTSPYYINITHRDRSRMARLGGGGGRPVVTVADATFSIASPRQAPPSPAGQPAPLGRVNLFQLTRENLQELTAEVARTEVCTVNGRVRHI